MIYEKSNVSSGVIILLVAFKSIGKLRDRFLFNATTISLLNEYNILYLALR